MLIDATRVIDIHLSLEPTDVGGLKLISSLTAAIKDARKVTGRDGAGKVFSGRDPLFQDPGMWLGAVGYMITLDQIGACYRPKRSARPPSPEPLKNDFCQALYWFSEPAIEIADIKLLYGLRNSFVHDYSILKRTREKNGKLKKPCILFLLSQNEGEPLLRSSNEEWDGNLETLDKSKHEVRVNLRALGDLVESIYQQLLLLRSEDNLEIHLLEKEPELLKRYTFGIDLPPMENFSNAPSSGCFIS